MKIQPKNWMKFQHYKDRVPPWIKLHRELLDDYEFHLLPVASKALAPFLWLLASEYDEGTIDASLEKLTFRFRMTQFDFLDALGYLEKSGFFSVYRDASETLATCKQDAPLGEERREETEAEKEEEKSIAQSDESLPAVHIIKEDPVVLIPLIDKTEFPIFGPMVDEFATCYPAVDVLKQLLAMRAWCISNPRLRKTKAGIMRFINTWLSKEQDKGHRFGSQVQTRTERNAEAAREAGRMLGVYDD